MKEFFFSRECHLLPQRESTDNEVPCGIQILRISSVAIVIAIYINKTVLDKATNPNVIKRKMPLLPPYDRIYDRQDRSTLENQHN